MTEEKWHPKSPKKPGCHQHDKCGSLVVGFLVSDHYYFGLIILDFLPTQNEYF